MKKKIPIYFFRFSRNIADLETCLVSLDEIKKYFNIPQENLNINDYPIDQSWPTKGHIKFINYSTKYSQDSDYVIKKLNLEIMPKEIIGIIGASGSGKTTIFFSLLRLYEHNEGEILIDDINIKNIGLHDLRSKISLITKNPILLAGPLRKNLDPYDKHSDKEIWDILALVNLNTFVADLYEDLQFKCESGGSNLAVGARQKLCLAKAVIRKSKIILFDEADGLDDSMHEIIKSIFSDCTVLTIAHSLNSIVHCTKYYIRIIIVAKFYFFLIFF